MVDLILCHSSHMYIYLFCSLLSHRYVEKAHWHLSLPSPDQPFYNFFLQKTSTPLFFQSHACQLPYNSAWKATVTRLCGGFPYCISSSLKMRMMLEHFWQWLLVCLLTAVDLCADAGCDRCAIKNGAPTCYCLEGYKLADDRKTCEGIIWLKHLCQKKMKKYTERKKRALFKTD